MIFHMGLAKHMNTYFRKSFPFQNRHIFLNMYFFVLGLQKMQMYEWKHENTYHEKNVYFGRKIVYESMYSHASQIPRGKS